VIVFVTTDGHDYTMKSLIDGAFGVLTPKIGHITYDAIFRADAVPVATYIFTDLDRLAAWEKRLAADLFSVMKQAGLQCLNDPARVPGRHALLSKLYRAGLNPVRSYRAEEAPRPDRFPVFIRGDADHRAPLSDLIDDQAALEGALEDLTRKGIPREGVIVVEYHAEQFEPGLWRKWSVFRVGERYHTDICVIEDRWAVKYGKKGLATDAMFQAEHDAVKTNAYAETLKPFFECAGMEYGRADFSFIGDKAVLYEINTNPNLTVFEPHPRSALRTETTLMARRRFADCLVAIDTWLSGDQAIERPQSLIDYAKHNKNRRPVFRP